MARNFILLVGAILIASVIFAEKRWVVTKISDEGSNFFTINKKGQIAYVGVDAQGQQQIYLYSNGITTKITQDLPFSYGYSYIDMNDNGHIVWSMWSYENSAYKYILMFYDGTVKKILDNLFYCDVDLYVQINNSDEIVFQHVPYWGTHPQVYKFDGKLHNLRTNYDNPNSYPVINDNGIVAWYSDNRSVDDWDNRIYFTNKGDTVANSILSGSNRGFSPQIDNLDNIVYACYSNTTSSYDLFQYNKNSSVMVDDSIFQYSYSCNNGYIAYTKKNADGY